MASAMEPGLALDVLARLETLVRVQALAKIGEYFGERVGLTKRDIEHIIRSTEVFSSG